MNEQTQNFHEQKQKGYEMLLNVMLREAKTPAEKARWTMGKIYLANTADDGRFGRIDELFSCTEHSKKVRCSKQGVADSYIRFLNENGKTVNRPFERKTNGGRIGEMVRRLEQGKDTLLVYSMDICNSNTKGQQRTIEPLLMLFSDFYRVLLECNAIKDTNGQHNEKAIQVTSKKLYLRLLDYPIPYDPNTVYSIDDITGIEW